METIKTNGISGKLLTIVMIAWAIMGLTNDLNGQILLGRYNIEGADLAAAVTITDNPYNLTFNDLILNSNSVVVFTYDAGFLKTTGWGTGFNTNKNVEIRIQRNGNQSFKVSHIKVYYTSAASRDFRIFANDIIIATRASVASAATVANKTMGEIYLSAVAPAITAHDKIIPHVTNDDVQSLKFAVKNNGAFDIDKIEIYGFINFKLFEDFNHPSIVTVAKTSAATLADFNTFSLDSLRYPGWTGSAANHYAFAVTNDRTSNLLLGGTSIDSAYIKSPAVDLSSPYEIQFEYRSRIGASNNGILKIYDNNGQIWSGTSTATSFTAVTTEGFIGSAIENITLAVPKLDGSEQIVDNFVVLPTTKPALNFALQSTKVLGTATKSTSKVFNLPLKAANLTGDVTLALQSGTNFTLSGGTTVTQANAEAGTDIAVTFNAPATVGTYTDVLTISAAGTTDRVVTLSAESDLGTGMENLKTGSVAISGSQLLINGHAGKKATIYNLSGAALFVQDKISDSQVFTLPSKGVYLLKVEGDNLMPVAIKVMIK